MDTADTVIVGDKTGIHQVIGLGIFHNRISCISSDHIIPIALGRDSDLMNSPRTCCMVVPK